MLGFEGKVSTRWVSMLTSFASFSGYNSTLARRLSTLIHSARERSPTTNTMDFMARISESKVVHVLGEYWKHSC
jgi:hypothetical protein